MSSLAPFHQLILLNYSLREGKEKNNMERREGGRGEESEGGREGESEGGEKETHLHQELTSQLTPSS